MSQHSHPNSTTNSSPESITLQCLKLVNPVPTETNPLNLPMAIEKDQAQSSELLTLKNATALIREYAERLQHLQNINQELRDEVRRLRGQNNQTSPQQYLQSLQTPQKGSQTSSPITFGKKDSGPTHKQHHEFLQLLSSPLRKQADEEKDESSTPKFPFILNQKVLEEVKVSGFKIEQEVKVGPGSEEMRVKIDEEEEPIVEEDEQNKTE